ncbi:hypothetical protein [Alsobacter metallidurans]|uniref:hypothetical protein n=1 Tax=Alsobacter metallidurans TaxID=340221 RepID=UPI0016667536|nr:hypothetical protein [Alsobacter metallidurans]
MTFHHAFARELDDGVLRWRFWQGVDEIKITNAKTLESDAYTGPILICGKGSADLKLWATLIQKPRLSKLKDRADYRGLQALVWAGSSKAPCGNNVVRFESNEADEYWEFSCKIPLRDAKQFLAEFQRSGRLGFSVAGTTDQIDDPGGSDDRKQFVKACNSRK